MNQRILSLAESLQPCGADLRRVLVELAKAVPEDRGPKPVYLGDANIDRWSVPLTPAPAQPEPPKPAMPEPVRELVEWVRAYVPHAIAKHLCNDVLAHYGAPQ